MAHRILVAVALAAPLAACAKAPDAAPAPAPGVTAAPVVYGDDDRTEWYAVTDPTIRELARSAVVAMVPNEAFTTDPETGAVSFVDETSIGDEEGLCADVPFRDQPGEAECSGVLIDDRLVMTAGHCVTSLADCAGVSWVFDFRYVGPGELAPLSSDDVYRCVDLVTNGFDDVGENDDFAIVELDRPVVGRTPATVRAEGAVKAGAGLLLAGFPDGGPMKIAPNGVVRDGRATQLDYFNAAIDAFSGNSGSAVFDDALTVAGIEVTGADDYNYDGSCGTLSVLGQNDGQESLTYAFQAVKELCAKGYPSATLCPGGAARCGDGWCTDGETAATCAGDCDQLFAVPATWTCNPGWYGAHDDCDCGCGAFDPDCADPSATVYHCAPGSACNADGSCQTPITSAWTCDPDYYGVGDGCDCGCGARDPDCDEQGVRVYGCATSECDADGTCAVPLPDDWQCQPQRYGSGGGCDCGCGAPDPDCADASAAVTGCAPGSACNADGTCATPIPATWVCSHRAYGDGSDCDCDCGAPDPDCADPSADVVNCPRGDTCDTHGACSSSTTPADPGPEVGPETAPETAAETSPEADTGPEPVVETAPESDASGADASAGDASAEGADAAPGHKDSGCGAGGLDGTGGAIAALIGAVVGRRRRGP